MRRCAASPPPAPRQTGGTVDEVIDEAHLGPGHIVDAIARYVAERPARVEELWATLTGPNA